MVAGLFHSLGVNLAEVLGRVGREHPTASKPRQRSVVHTAPRPRIGFLAEYLAIGCIGCQRDPLERLPAIDLDGSPCGGGSRYVGPTTWRHRRPLGRERHQHHDLCVGLSRSAHGSRSFCDLHKLCGWNIRPNCTVYLRLCESVDWPHTRQRRHKRNDGRRKIVYAYDGGQIALEFDKAGTGDLAATDLSHRYLWNPQAVDQFFADEQVHYDSGEAAFVTDALLWALTDHQNSIRDLATYDSNTDVTTIANHRVFDSYGNLKSQTNAAVDCLFGNTGRQFDEATSL